MPETVFNFSAGPAVLPPPVLKRAKDELLSFRGSGMSVMEISHRSSLFDSVLDAAEAGIRSLLDVPANYQILFLQGGATLQFSMVPINFLRSDRSADYIITGAWGKKALPEARRCGRANIIFSSESTGSKSVPLQEDLRFSSEPAYVHYTSNETIDGVEFKYDLDGDGVPVVCDASSNILSKVIDIEKYAIIYAGAQKNIGPSGVTVVIIRDDMLARVPANQHSSFNYRHIAENRSMANTPNTWGIYLISLVCEWLTELGGLSAIEKLNKQKAGILYEAIDSSDGYYSGHADRAARSLMNVTFRLSSPDLDEKFAAEAEAAGFNGLKGHRSVGGIRASIYNAFPLKGVEELVGFMKEFAEKNG